MTISDWTGAPGVKCPACGRKTCSVHKDLQQHSCIICGHWWVERLTRHSHHAESMNKEEGNDMIKMSPEDRLCVSVLLADCILQAKGEEISDKVSLYDRLRMLEVFIYGQPYAAEDHVRRVLSDPPSDPKVIH